jgi:hypothetical protein
MTLPMTSSTELVKKVQIAVTMAIEVSKLDTCHRRQASTSVMAAKAHWIKLHLLWWMTWKTQTEFCLRQRREEVHVALASMPPVVGRIVWYFFMLTYPMLILTIRFSG